LEDELKIHRFRTASVRNYWVGTKLRCYYTFHRADHPKFAHYQLRCVRPRRTFAAETRLSRQFCRFKRTGTANPRACRVCIMFRQRQNRFVTRSHNIHIINDGRIQSQRGLPVSAVMSARETKRKRTRERRQERRKKKVLIENSKRESLLCDPHGCARRHIAYVTIHIRNIHVCARIPVSSVPIME